MRVSLTGQEVRRSIRYQCRDKVPVTNYFSNPIGTCGRALVKWAENGAHLCSMLDRVEEESRLRLKCLKKMTKRVLGVQEYQVK